MILRCAVVALALSVSTATWAAEIGCKAPFTPDATLADFEKAFGKANVKTGEVDGPEGTTMIATTVFPKNPRKKFEIYWNDEETRTGLAGWTIAVDDTGPGGLRQGMSIADVQKINGAPFTLSGFYWDYGGSASFDEGKLANLPDKCYVSLRFNPTVENASDAVESAISGEQTLNSDMPELKIVKPIVSEISMGYIVDDPDDGSSDPADDSGDTGGGVDDNADDAAD